MTIDSKAIDSKAIDSAVTNVIIIDLQEKISHQGQDIQHLSDVLYQQQQKIAFLEKHVAILSDKLKILSDESDISYEAQRPPHY